MKTPASHARPARNSLFGKLRNWAVAGFCLLAPLPALAGYVTTNEAGMDAIFSQATFGTSPIDIRFNAVQTVNNSALMNIDSAAEFWSLGGLVAVPSHTVLAFFVDKISWCGGPGGSIIGCGEMPGDVFTVDSSWAAKPAYGAALIAHELGHNLGLDHYSGSGNLMYPYLTGASALTSTQTATILGSSLVQTDAFGHRFISITPVAVVPEPETALMFAVGLLALAARRQRSAARD